MIKKLEKKFIILATISMAVLMTILILSINIINLNTVINEIDETIEMLNQSDNRPESKPGTSGKEKDSGSKKTTSKEMSPETLYESRYFTVVIDEDGEIKETNFSKIISVDETEAEDYVSKVLNRGNEYGFVGHFRYQKFIRNTSTKIIFYDCGRKLDAFYSFMWTSIAIAVLGCIIVFVIFMLFASKIVRPISESYEKQKRFITDAGHEIKTPLTIISANADLLELDTGENECIDEIKNQTVRLSNLTKDLVYLTKMEEANKSIPKVTFPLSDLISEASQQFRAIATAHNKNYACNIQPDISFLGSPEEIRQLTTIILDNAMKYSPENGDVTLNLSSKKKTITLSVSNSTAENVDKENISKVFDRFYRMDSSRNSKAGGHGIGLSIAKAIAESNSGKITASTKTGKDFCITFIFTV